MLLKGSFPRNHWKAIGKQIVLRLQKFRKPKKSLVNLKHAAKSTFGNSQHKNVM
jgi:hypothetical protein